VIWIAAIIAAVVIADAIWARANLRLRTRATHGARQQHDLIAGASGSGAWRSLNEEAGERAEPEVGSSFTRLDRIVGNNDRREPPRRGDGPR
jgi:hypothetical protein